MSDLRQEVDNLIAAGAVETAVLRLREFWRKECGPASAAFVVSRFQKLLGRLPLVSYRLAILRSFTVEPVIPLLRATALLHGIDLAVHVGDFNAYPQEILDATSSLYSFKPDAVILAVGASDLSPDLWRDYADLSFQSRESAIQQAATSMQAWVRSFREHSAASLIIHNLEQPEIPSLGVLDAQANSSQKAAFEQINRQLCELAGNYRGVFVLDYDSLVARHGRLRWHDRRKWLTARMPIAADQLIHLAHEWLRFLVPLIGKTAKVLVVDLDNTLWGGVIGEDGMQGIKLGPEYPGAAYQALQRAMLDLSRKGILLAIASKNNRDDATEVLENHSGMLLRPHHFAAMRISWDQKAQSLREIAAELNVGIDTLAFLDDNPVERESIRVSLPEVTVIELPDDPLEYADALRNCPAFERLTLSAEDQQRTALYAAQRERSQAEESFSSKEDFFRFLEQRAEIARVTPATLARISQLTQKTNQFNLTTRRYSEQQISDLAAQSGTDVLSIRLRDRYGDHGLVGVAITRDHGTDCEIDTFLLSCRVIGRTVETVFLSQLAQGAARRGRQRLLGWFLPTRKNAPAKEFYAQHGFELQSESADGSLWALDLKQHAIACPAWTKLDGADGEPV